MRPLRRDCRQTFSLSNMSNVTFFKLNFKVTWMRNLGSTVWHTIKNLGKSRRVFIQLEKKTEKSRIQHRSGPVDGTDLCGRLVYSGRSAARSCSRGTRHSRACRHAWRTRRRPET